MILSEVQQRTDDVTSAGVMSLGIMPVTVARCNSGSGLSQFQ